ncbi:STAS domain-containing protein [Nonomuraea sp. NPDC059194]|uniref:STAS domain-containing protein n=1 Tax=Nonomuraea sp. NPDC059194 TaxID=3346764 RepID=UPI0036938B1B
MEDAERGFTLQVSISDHVGYTTVSARGALDRVSGPVLLTHVDAAWEWTEGPHLILDVGGIWFCDFEGVSTLVSIARRLHDSRTGRVILVGADGRLERMLRRTGLLHYFERRDSAEQAGADLLHGRQAYDRLAAPAPPGRGGF